MSEAVATVCEPKVKVGKSPIHGKGLFAAEVVSKDTLIGRYDGPQTKTDGTYVLWVMADDDEPYAIDGKNDLRFVNHSSDPNADFYGDELYAIRTIEPGEEITFHYGDDWE